MEAISSGSPSKAGHLMKNHVLDAMGFLIDIMKKRDKYNL
jgi:DNA-binding GntR family transcriptional regulator